ncbi:glycosyltransferase family 25 protein [Xanthobacter versatilis]|uniref:glycosyltransferase family 25 protein n=1 Tax=Xanthobacter autotrophicus (strain ATCC BAA-1158 / Py2) TaxID=78245 RepID=UPI00372C71DB
MLIFVINLARRPDRLAFMRGQLDALGLAFERIEAVDGQREDVGQGTDLITPVEIACAMSHRKAWQRFLETGENRCLILEDDVLIAPRAKLLLEDPRHLPADADIVRLETGLQKSLVGRARRCGLAGHRVHALYSRHHGSAACIITRGFAERAVRSLTTFVEPIDDIMFAVNSPNYFPSIRYQMRPGLCIQADLYHPSQQTKLAQSDLQPDRLVRVLGRDPVPPPPKMKVVRSFPEKCLREVGRWRRRSLGSARTLYDRLIVGRSWRLIPFSGPILPVAAAAISVDDAQDTRTLAPAKP